MNYYCILDSILTLEKTLWSSMEEKGNKRTYPWRQERENRLG